MGMGALKCKRLVKRYVRVLILLAARHRLGL